MFPFLGLAPSMEEETVKKATSVRNLICSVGRWLLRWCFASFSGHLLNGTEKTEMMMMMATFSSSSSSVCVCMYEAKQSRPTE